MARKPVQNTRTAGRTPHPARRGTRVSLAGDSRLPHVLAPRRRPGQTRSHGTVDAILQAAAQLFGRRGYARTNTNEIAARAGVSVGSLYQYFPNKDAILTALLERHLDAVNDILVETLPLLGDPGVSLRAAVRELLERLQALHRANPDLAHAVDVQAAERSRIPSAFRERERRYVAELQRVLLARPDIRPGPRSLMASLLLEIAETATAWLAHSGIAEASPVEALDEAAEAICRYVGA